MPNNQGFEGFIVTTHSETVTTSQGDGGEPIGRGCNLVNGLFRQAKGILAVCEPIHKCRADWDYYAENHARMTHVPKGYHRGIPKAHDPAHFQYRVREAVGRLGVKLHLEDDLYKVTTTMDQGLWGLYLQFLKELADWLSMKSERFDQDWGIAFEVLNLPS